MTIDEQLLSCIARCAFIQYMPNEQNKFEIKFWMVVDAETKYLFNRFPYLRKDENRDTSVSLQKYVVTKLMQPIFKRGYNETCDNFFTSLDVALHLANQNAVWLAQSDKIEEICQKLPKKSSSSTKLPCLHLLKQLLLL